MNGPIQRSFFVWCYNTNTCPAAIGERASAMIIFMASKTPFMLNLKAKTPELKSEFCDLYFYYWNAISLWRLKNFPKVKKLYGRFKKTLSFRKFKVALKRLNDQKFDFIIKWIKMKKTFELKQYCNLIINTINEKVCRLWWAYKQMQFLANIMQNKGK